MANLILSDNEMAVLVALWDAEEPLSRPEILRRVTKTDWNPNSIHIVLNNLIKKGLIQVGDLTRCGQSYGRTYYPLKTRGEYAAELALNAVPDVPKTECILNVMSAMIKKDGIDEKTIRELEQMLEQRYMELELEKNIHEKAV